MAVEKNQKQAEQYQSDMMKKFKQNPAVFIGTVIVLVLVIVTFVFWGAGDWILPRSGVLSDDQLTFGYYNEIPVKLTAGSFFAEQREYYLQQQRQMRDERYATEEAFKSAVQRVAILDMMKKIRYEPPEKLIDKKVAELPRYQEDGKFSVLKWRQDDASYKAGVIREVHDSFIISRYYADVAGQQLDDGRSDPNIWTAPKYSYSVLSSSKEAEFIGAMAKVQRKFKFAVFPYRLFPDSEITAFVEKNPALFKNTHLSQITIPSIKGDGEARKVRESILQGTTTFEDAAKSHSEDEYKESGGDAGKRMAFEIVSLISNETVRAAVVNLDAGALSDPVKVPTGWAIFRAENAVETPDSTDSAVLEKIRNYMYDSERGTVEDWLIDRAASFAKVVGNSDWDTAIIAYNVDESKVFGPLPLNYGDSMMFSTVQSFASSIPELRNARTSENFWKKAFSTPVGKPSEPFVINAGQQNVVVLLPFEENNDDEDTVKNSINYFKSTFIQRDIFDSVQDSILNSPKFKNDFDRRYMELFVFNSGF